MFIEESLTSQPQHTLSVIHNKESGDSWQVLHAAHEFTPKQINCSKSCCCKCCCLL